MGSYPSGANGFATVDARNPVAFAICDRCGQRYNRTDLTWQYEWQGAELQNQRILVCRRKCLDIPNEQLRAYAVPPDPLPVSDPRPDLSYMGLAPVIVYTVAGSSQTLIGANSARTMLDFALPPSFGLWLNPTGGTCGPALAGCEFYAPGTAYTATDAAAQPAMTYYTTIAGLQVVVENG